MKSDCFRSVFLLVVVIALGLVPAFGQATAGIRGTVSDPTGAVVPGAKVTATETDTGFTRTVATNSSGVYTLTLLPVGTYSLTVTETGFKRFQQTEIVLTTNQILGLNVTLQLGAVAQKVEVRGGAPIVNTQTTSVSTLINSQQIKQLPLNGRNPIQLATLTTGINASSTTEVITYGTSNHLSVDGNQEFMTQFLLDGGEYEEPTLNGGLDYPNPDALREFRFITNMYSAEYGKVPGGVMNVVTKSGTNQIHGGVWEFNRNSAVAARPFFQPKVPFLNQNQFGFDLGGPVKKDKLFLFGTAQWLKIAQGRAVSAAFPPTAAERQGDFSGDPGAVIDPQTGNPFPGNIIPQSRLDPVVQKYMKLIPLPNSPDGRYIGAFPEPTDNYQVLVKPTWDINNSQRLSGSVFLVRTTATSRLDFGRLQVPLVNTTGPSLFANTVNTSNVILNHTWNLSADVLNEARFQFTRQYSLAGAPGRGPTMQDLGANYPSFPLQDVPNISATGRYFVGTGNFNSSEYNEYQYADNISYIQGRHSIKVGANLHHINFDSTSSANDMGVFFGTGGVTGNSLADTMLGQTESYVSNPLLSSVSTNDFAAYIQDDYKVSRNVVLNLGLRYEAEPMWNSQPIFKTPSNGYLRGGASFQQGLQSVVFKNAPKGLIFPSSPGFGGAHDDSLPTSGSNTDWNNFAPRVGVAWDVFGNGKTAVRAGWGLFYQMWQINALQGSLEGPPFFVNFFQQVTPNLVDPVGAISNKFPIQYTQNLDFTPFLPMSLQYLDPNIRNPDIQQFNVTVEQELGRRVSAQISYVGNVSQHLLFFNEQNPAKYIAGVDSNGNPLSTLANTNSRRVVNQSFLPGTPFGAIGVGGSAGSSNYNSLQAQVRTNNWHGLSALASYTWSKSIDLSSFLITTGTIGGFGQNPFNTRADRAVSNFNRSQIFAGSIVYDTPSVTKAFQIKNPIAKGIADNWEISSIISLGSGYPFTVTTGTDNSRTGQNQDRPNLVGDPYLSTSRPRGQLIQEYFNPAAFTPNPIGTFGDAGRNILNGPGSATVDFGLYKNFPLGEARRLQFRFEFFNFFNRPNFGNPVSVLSAGPRVGLITTSGPGRIIQFGAKVAF